MKYSIYSTAGTVKKENQDAYLLRVARKQEHVLGMAAICDGVSSVDDGAYASHFVVKSLETLFDQLKHHDVDISEEVMKIHQALIKQGKRKHVSYGTTCSLFLFYDDTYRYVQIGDSRIYLYTNTLQQLTSDQTLARQKYDMKTISLEEYHLSNERHVLTQCMGITKELHMVSGSGIWKEDHGILLCSDGLYNLVPHQELVHMMDAFLHEECVEPAKELAMIAMELGEQDNVSAMTYTRKGESDEETLS